MLNIRSLSFVVRITYYSVDGVMFSNYLLGFSNLLHQVHNRRYSQNEFQSKAVGILRNYSVGLSAC